MLDVFRKDRLLRLCSSGGNHRDACGEVLALRWAEVDFDRKFLRVARSLEEIRSSGLRFKQAKTAKSRGWPLNGDCPEGAQEPHGEQAEERLHFGKEYQDQGAVFCEPDGSSYRPDKFTSHWRSRMARPGCHTCASTTSATRTPHSS